MKTKQEKIFSLANVIITLVIIAALGVLCSLGVWQFKRLAWKENLLATIEARLDAEPINIDDVLKQLNDGIDFEYTPITVTGEFDHSGEAYFFATHKGRSGYFVYTPLSTAQGIIFINRGFVDFDAKDPQKRQDGQIEGRVEITGLARQKLEEKPSSIVPDNDVSQNIYYWKDLDAMAKSAGIEPQSDQLIPFFIDQKLGANPTQYPIGGVTLIDLPNNHLQYALTWFSLAGVLLIGSLIMFVRQGQNQKK